MPDWNFDPFNDRKWSFRFHHLAFISHLLAWHKTCRRDDALDLALALILSWWRAWRDKKPDSCNEFIWHDHGTALRAEQVLLFLAYIEKYSTQWKNRHQKELTDIYDMLRQHGQLLASDGFYSRGSNHGLEQMRALLMLSSCLKGEYWAGWRQLAVLRIFQEYDAAFTAEGAHKENSPGYHCLVMNIFLNLASAYGNELKPLQEKLDKDLGKILEFLTHVVRPDGNFPPLGDTELLRPNPALTENGKNSTEYKQLRYSLTQGREGLKPEKNILFLPKSGYAIIRNSWKDNAHWNEMGQFIIKGGALSSWHYHRDEGSILLFAFGEDWLIDSGMYNHNKCDPIRLYMRSANAHNVAIIQGSTYKKINNGLFSSWRMKNKMSRNAYEVEIVLKILNNIKQIRKIAINLEDLSFTVRDSFHFSNKDSQEVFLNWHISSDKKIERQGEIARIYGKEKMLELSASHSEEINEITGYQDCDNASLLSSHINKSVNSFLLRPKYRIRNGASIITKFRFHPLPI